MRLGRTTATYWSPATTFRPTPLALPDAINWPRDLALFTTGCNSCSRNPACSRIAANDKAARTSQTVVSKLAIPPREKSWSIPEKPVLLT
jgi:hypothetical protein